MGMGREVGARTSAAAVPGGGGRWLRQTFAVGRLSRRSVEIRIACAGSASAAAACVARSLPRRRGLAQAGTVH
jgi:hypothetical protein